MAESVTAPSKYRLHSTGKPMAFGMPSRRPKGQAAHLADPVLEIAGSGTKPHPKLAGRPDHVEVTAEEWAELQSRPAVKARVASGELVATPA